MDQEIFDWLLLLGRWLHITTAITWIGTSIFFMWLDRTFEQNANSKNPGHVGDLWMVHGGGFYHVEKLLMGPTKVPEHLHWFKWESYWTWLSGVFLLLLIFYTGGGTFLLDSSVSEISYFYAVLIGVSSIVVSWLFYDFLWETKLTKTNPILGHILTFLWVAGATYLLCYNLSGRAAYMHIGAMLGTWMTANVFLRIIPRQVRMVEASKRGEPVHQEWGKNAKNRSTHNTYLTLPVIFIMLSNHFPSTYGNKHNWLILLLVGVAGASIREFFMSRLRNPVRSKAFGATGVFILLAVIIFFRENSPLATGDQSIPNQLSSPIANQSLDTTKQPSDQFRNVNGVVKFEGQVPRGEKIALSPDCAKNVKGDVYSDAILVSDGKLKNVLVRVIQGLDGKVFPDVPKEPILIDQRNCQYVPRVVAVRVGQRVEFINSDSTFHNVRSVTKANEDFNVGMPMQSPNISRVFTKPEIVLQTKCSVHPWMTASIAVMDHPYFALSDKDGRFAIKDLPPGHYTIEAWHEKLGSQTKEIDVKENEALELDFTFKP
jgi:uncharacterized membrane protein/plastocyanin